MDDFFAPLGTRSSTTQNEFLPPVDIYEKEEKVFFEAELPGFNKEDLKVGVQGKIITLSGERQMETGEENRFRKERRYGRFERSFQLGFEADGNMIEAKYENGVLTVIVSRPEEIKAKQIEIH
jgi:HSP20 family protein